MVLSHVEASQSGVAAAALGAGMPVVATPVGGLIEQILDGRTGVVALRADAAALSEALEDLLLNPVLYNSICANIAATRETRSMGRFAKECIAHLLRCSAESNAAPGN
jgi:glycosyltransferase involved in cell wall biosynthesis